jgi:hypothetical protein
LGADEFDIVAGESTRFVEGHGSVEGGLASESGKNCVRFFLSDDLLTTSGVIGSI